MNLFEYIKMSFASIAVNKLRALLIMGGIALGICSVITIVSIGKSGQAAISNELEKLGINAINIKSKSGVAYAKDLLKLEDAENIRKHISEVTSVTPVFNGFGIVKRNSVNREAFIWGIDQTFEDIFSLQLLHGRLMSEADIRERRKVIVIDDVLAKKLFHRQNVVGRKLKLSSRGTSEMLTVIGVIENVNELFGELFGDAVPAFVYMPITTLQKIYNTDSVDQISIKVEAAQEADDVGIKVVNFLERQRHKKGKYYAENMIQQKENFYKITTIFTLVIGAIGAVSLVVGGFGIMNIMLASVTERIREIGIRKALGARKKDILFQFLIEAIILTLLGGVVGVLAGIFFGWLISYFSGLPFEISIPTIIVTLAFSALIGLVFGVYPAGKAANLQPVEALRYE